MYFADKILRFTENIINFQRKRSWKRTQRQKKLSSHREWIEALVWSLAMVLIINQFFFQLYVIPSSSMEKTLLVRDRVVVNKFIYGPELLPFFAKFPALKKLKRGDVIIFVSPDYQSRGTAYALTQRILYMLSFTLLDLDRIYSVADPESMPVKLRAEIQNASPLTKQLSGTSTRANSFQPQLLIKRAVAYSKDTLRFLHGNALVRPAGSKDFIEEKAWKTELQLEYGNQRLVAEEFQEIQDPQENNIFTSFMQNPHSLFARNRFFHYNLGAYVPSGYLIPYGDNRDNSHDGRWFGIIEQRSLLGQASYIIYPFWRFGSIQ